MRARDFSPPPPPLPHRSILPFTHCSIFKDKAIQFTTFVFIDGQPCFLCYIAYEIVYKRNTNSYFSLSVGSDTQGQRERGRAGEGGQRDFAFGGFFFGFVFLPGCALLTRSSKEGRSQPGRERRERVRLRVSTLNAGKPPPPSARAENQCHLSPVLGTDTTQGSAGSEAIL